MKTAASLLAVIACSSDPPPDFSLTDEHTASAISNSCSTAASAAGAPDDVVNFLAHPHDSTPQERQRIAIYLEAIGVAEHCPEFTGDDARNEHTASPEEHGKLEEPVHLEPLPVNVQQFPEELRRLCQAWALENLSPVAYEEFRQLRPERMDDLDRRIWGERFNRQSLWRYRSNLAGSGEQFWHPTASASPPPARIPRTHDGMPRSHARRSTSSAARYSPSKR